MLHLDNILSKNGYLIPITYIYSFKLIGIKSQEIDKIIIEFVTFGSEKWVSEM